MKFNKAASKWIDLEVTPYCNSHCIMCPRTITRPLGFMKPEVFKKIADEFISSGIQIVNFCGYGEPLLNKYIFDYIKHIRQYGLLVVIRTNGFLLTEEVIKGLIDADINAINVSVHGITKRVYEIIMQGLRFEITLKNLEILQRVTEGSSVKLIINSVEISPNAHEVPFMAEFWKERGFDNFEFDKCHSRGSELIDSSLFLETRIKLWKGKCPIFPFITYVGWNGDILACCQDAVEGTTKLGNLLETSFTEIMKLKEEKYNNPFMFDLCEYCDRRVSYNWLKNII